MKRIKGQQEEKRKERHLTKKQQWMIAGAATLITLVVVGLVGYYIGRPLMNFISEPEKFRAWVELHGIVGRITFMGIVILQIIIAIIPGEPIEIAGGYAFGMVEGTLLYLGAAALGSVIVFLLVRKFGIRLLEVFFPRKKIESLNFLKKNKKRYVLFFIIFLIPGTPKDLLCYYAGLTDMKLSAFMLINIIGRLPALISSAAGGDALGMQSYVSAIVVFAVTIVLSGVGLLIYKQMNRKK